MYEKLYNGRMGGDLYRLQRSRAASDGKPLQAPMPASKPVLAENIPEKKGVASLLPRSISEIADSDDLLILGLILFLLSEKNNTDLVAALAMILLK